MISDLVDEFQEVLVGHAANASCKPMSEVRVPPGVLDMTKDMLLGGERGAMTRAGSLYV